MRKMMKMRRSLNYLNLFHFPAACRSLLKITVSSLTGGRLVTDSIITNCSIILETIPRGFNSISSGRIIVSSSTEGSSLRSNSSFVLRGKFLFSFSVCKSSSPSDSSGGSDIQEEDDEEDDEDEEELELSESVSLSESESESEVSRESGVPACSAALGAVTQFPPGGGSDLDCGANSGGCSSAG